MFYSGSYLFAKHCKTHQVFVCKFSIKQEISRDHCTGSTGGTRANATAWLYMFMNDYFKAKVVFNFVQHFNKRSTCGIVRRITWEVVAIRTLNDHFFFRQ